MPTKNAKRQKQSNQKKIDKPIFPKQRRSGTKCYGYDPDVPLHHSCSHYRNDCQHEEILCKTYKHVLQARSDRRRPHHHRRRRCRCRCHRHHHHIPPLAHALSIATQGVAPLASKRVLL
eukprot:3252416-Amphidinium_carterae.1